MKTFQEFLNEKALPSTAQKVLADLEDEDAKILDVISSKDAGEEIYSIYVKYNSGNYEVISVVDKVVTKRDMEPVELRRYKTGH